MRISKEQHNLAMKTYRAKKKEQGLVMLTGLYCKPEHRQAIRDFAKTYNK